MADRPRKKALNSGVNPNLVTFRVTVTGIDWATGVPPYSEWGNLLPGVCLIITVL